jgi:hypothetical protein
MCADPDERHAFEIRPACGCVPCKCAILRGHEHEGLTHQHLDIEIPAVSGDQRDPEFDLSSIDELGDFRDRIVVDPKHRIWMLALEALQRSWQVAGGNGRQAADSKDFLTQPPVLPQRIER